MTESFKWKQFLISHREQKGKAVSPDASHSSPQIGAQALAGDLDFDPALAFVFCCSLAGWLWAGWVSLVIIFKVAFPTVYIIG